MTSDKLTVCLQAALEPFLAAASLAARAAFSSTFCCRGRANAMTR